MTPPPVDREMTRAEMVEGLERVADGGALDDEHTAIAQAAAAELSKSCAGCRHRSGLPLT